MRVRSDMLADGTTAESGVIVPVGVAKLVDGTEFVGGAASSTEAAGGAASDTWTVPLGPAAGAGVTSAEEISALWCWPSSEFMETSPPFAFLSCRCNRLR